MLDNAEESRVNTMLLGWSVYLTRC